MTRDSEKGVRRVTYQNDLELYERNKSTCEREMENLRNRYCESAGISLDRSDLDQHESVRCMRGERGSVSFPRYQIAGNEYQRIFQMAILQAYQSSLTSSAVLGGCCEAGKDASRYLEELVEVTIGANQCVNVKPLLTIDTGERQKKMPRNSWRVSGTCRRYA